MLKVESYKSLNKSIFFKDIIIVKILFISEHFVQGNPDLVNVVDFKIIVTGS